MKIRDRLLMTAGSCIALILIFSSVVYISFNRVAEENERELIAQEIGHTVSDLNIIMYDYLTYREERMTQQWITKYDVSLGIIEKAVYKELEPLKADYVVFIDSTIVFDVNLIIPKNKTGTYRII